MRTLAHSSLPRSSVRQGHDLAPEPLHDPPPSVASSAVLSPYRHLLVPQTAPLPASDAQDAFAFVAAPHESEGAVIRPGAYSVASYTSDLGGSFSRRASLAGSALLSANDGGDAERGEPTMPLHLNPQEEERLADEWGNNDVPSNVEYADGAPEVASPALLSPAMSDPGLAHFPRRTAMSDAGMLDPVRGDEDGAEALDTLETRSAPDLDRPRPLSFADLVFEGLEKRLQDAPARARPAAPVRATTEGGLDEGDDPGVSRIKIIERTATQRRQRRRMQSLEPSLALDSLASIADLSRDGSLDELSSGMRPGIASRDSLFAGPRAISSNGRASALSMNPSDLASAQRESSYLSNGSRPVSRLSLTLPSAVTEPPDPDSTSSPANPSGPFADAPRMSTSLSRPGTPGFTSRFDPVFIAAQRAELLKERPTFSNPDAGRPPKVVLMPAPLAGRPVSPPRRPVREGPDSDAGESDAGGEGNGSEEEEEDEELAPGLQEPRRPAGALYGRSLLDVMAERRALLKGQQRAYDPRADGRRSMFDWKDSPAAQDALAKLEGGNAAARSAGEDDERDDDVPLALVPAGGRQTQAQGGSPARPRKAAHASIFGPDLVYQRELARAKELEEQERAALEDERRAREDKRRSKGKLVKGAKRRSQMALNAAEATEWVSSERQTVEPVVLQENQVREEPRRREPSTRPQPYGHNLAPSLSIPLGLGENLTTSASGSDWFAPPVDSEPKRATVLAHDDDDDDEDADSFRPRPLSSLGAYQSPTANRGAFDSGSSSSGDHGDDDEVELTRTFADDGYAAAPRGTGARPLPFPGEPSSHGHDSASAAETDDDQPLGRRYSQVRARQSFVPSYSAAAAASAPMLPRPSEQRAVETRSAEAEVEDDDDDEDDKPLGMRYSTIQPVDVDDVPLAIHRLSLAPQQRQPYASATLHAVDDEGKTVVSDASSDDRPLGLKTAAAHPPVVPAFPYAMSQPALVPGMLPLPPGYPPFAVPPPPSAPFGSVPFVGPAPPDSHLQLALAQMQMQTAMQQQQPPGELAAGTGGMIERWRREVAP
ncbi:uncharacterized protein JCM10292_000137 [Rhodotorula paludigena]|uniref:uncharacterized protein n=1 Tax=Rhodotorula paludigena TaxID=86838 RepID=UPI00317A12B2